MSNSHITNLVNAIVNKISTLITSHNSNDDAHSSLFSNKAPTNHRSSASTYGIGTSTLYGHCKIVNNLNSSSYTNGEALSAYQGKVLNDRIGAAITYINQ